LDCPVPLSRLRIWLDVLLVGGHCRCGYGSIRPLLMWLLQGSVTGGLVVFCGESADEAQLALTDVRGVIRSGVDSGADPWPGDASLDPSIR
jgi:hypothetical protein